MQMAQSFDKAVEPKVLNVKHSEQVHEFILNKPATLNTLDLDMVNLML